MNGYSPKQLRIPPMPLIKYKNGTHIPDAKDARVQSDSNNDLVNEREMREVEEMILYAIKNGEYEVNLNYYVTSAIEDKLKALGYKVKKYNQYNDESTKIWW